MHLFLPTKIHTLFAHNRFSALKMPESEKINLESWIIDFRNVQVSLSHVSLSLNACKVMEAFLIFSHQKLKKTVNKKKKVSSDSEEEVKTAKKKK